MQGWISPARRMPGRAVGVAVLSVETRIETAHLGYPPPEVTAVTSEAYVAVAHKSRSVIDNPIVGVLSCGITGGSVGMAALPVESRIETADLGYSPLEV